jgi:vitamin B12 transporter
MNDDSSHVGGPYTKFAKAHYYGNSTVSELFANFKFSKYFSLVAGSQFASQNTDQSWYSLGLPSPWDPNPLPYQTALGDSAKTTNTSFYASLLMIDLKGFNTELGFRYNHHSIYGNNVTYTFNPSYNIDENTKVFVNISSGFKTPSLYQLYSEYGNKNLEPEKSNSYEMGVQAYSNNKRNSFRAVTFKRDIKNLIVFYTDMSTFESQYINRDEQHDYGFELESTIALGKTGSWITNFTYVDGEGENNGVKTRNMYRRPNFIVNSILTLQPCKGFTLMPSFKFVGTRLKGQYDAGTAQMPQYYTLDLYSSYDFAKSFRAFVDFRNITDQEYFDIVGYNSRKFNWSVGVSANF